MTMVPYCRQTVQLAVSFDRIVDTLTPSIARETASHSDFLIMRHGQWLALPILRQRGFVMFQGLEKFTIAFIGFAIAAPAYANQPGCYRSKPTFYNPSINNKMEGGAHTRFSGRYKKEYVNSVEDAINNGRPVTVAMDYKGEWGQRCNRREKRCTLLVTASGFDKAFPQYRKKFPNLPDNTFLAIVEDTGGAFYGKGTKKIDIATRNNKYYRSAPQGFSSLAFQVLEEPKCGTGSKARYCDLSDWRPGDVSEFAACEGGYFDRQRKQDQAAKSSSAPSTTTASSGSRPTAVKKSKPVAQVRNRPVAGRSRRTYANTTRRAPSSIGYSESWQQRAFGLQ